MSHNGLSSPVKSSLLSKPGQPSAWSPYKASKGRPLGDHSSGSPYPLSPPLESAAAAVIAAGGLPLPRFTPPPPYHNPLHHLLWAAQQAYPLHRHPLPAHSAAMEMNLEQIQRFFQFKQQAENHQVKELY
jgi:hypothetical protein